MIDPATEALISWQQVAKHVPGDPHISTLHRWRLRGVRGKKLETLLVGGKRFTSREAIDRFIAAGNADDAPATPTFTATQRQHMSNAARATLATEFGI